MFVLVPVTFLENSLVLVFDSLQISHPLNSLILVISYQNIVSPFATFFIQLGP